MSLSGAVLAAAAALSPAAGASVDVSTPAWEQRIESLERRQGELERRLPEGQRPVVVTAGDEGSEAFGIRSVDGGFKLRFAGTVQSDYRGYASGAAAGSVSEFLVRRARIYIEGVVGRHVAYRILPDFAAGQSLLQEAWVDLDYFPGARLMAGKFKEPLGLERLQAEVNTLFIERGLTADIAPNRDEGVQIHGDPDGRLGYEAAVVNGAPDGGIVDSDPDSGKDAVVRLFARPFGGGTAARGALGFGAAASYGSERGNAVAPNLSSYATEGQQTFFAFRPGTAASGRRRRVAPQAYWYPDRFSVLAEAAVSEQNVKLGGAAAELTMRSWQVCGGWVLTGEKTSFSGVTPRRAFDPSSGAWGAFELAVRYSELWVDRAAFPVFADPSVSSRAARAWTGGLSWYLRRGVRVGADYNATRLAGGSRSRESSIFTRLQLAF